MNYAPHFGANSYRAVATNFGFTLCSSGGVFRILTWGPTSRSIKLESLGMGIQVMGFFPPFSPKYRILMSNHRRKLQVWPLRTVDHGERSGTAADWEDITQEMVLKVALKVLLRIIEKFCSWNCISSSFKSLLTWVSTCAFIFWSQYPFWVYLACQGLGVRSPELHPVSGWEFVLTSRAIFL